MKLPSKYHLAKGYQVLVFGACWGKNENDGWTPINNTWGFPYTYKGFAINRAEHMMSWYNRSGIPNNKMFARVIDMETGEDVWQSDNISVNTHCYTSNVKEEE